MNTIEFYAVVAYLEYVINPLLTIMLVTCRTAMAPKTLDIMLQIVLTSTFQTNFLCDVECTYLGFFAVTGDAIPVAQRDSSAQQKTLIT